MIKWILRALLVVLVLVLGLIGTFVWTALRTENPVGFQMAQATDANGHPFPVGVWYPTESRPWPTTWLGLRMMEVARDAPVSGRDLPLVVISHGNAGGPGSHADLALALADAGYVVAAPMHIGDSFADQSAAGTVPWLGDRNRQLRGAIDYMLGDWQGRGRIDQDRIGAFGFSAGGMTVLTAVGAEPDLGLIADHCARTVEFICDLFEEGNSPLLNPELARAGNAFSPDPRIGAAVVAAPGLGFAMGPASLRNVNVPVQVWNGEEDSLVPFATNTSRVRDGLGARAEFHSIAGAGHFSFLAPCGALGPPVLCADQAGFDRSAFHASMNAQVIGFFDKHLEVR